VDVAGARAFVLAHGSAVDVARLEGIFGRTEPDRRVVKLLEGLQNPDGGFPITAVAGGLEAEKDSITVPDAPRAARDDATVPGGPATAGKTGASGESSVAATCLVLAQLRDIPPLAGSPMASRAVAFLRRSQAVDGSWSEAVAGPGSEVQDWPGRVNLAAGAAYVLAVMEPDHPDPIVRSAKWLRRTLADEGEHISADRAGRTSPDRPDGIHGRTLSLAAAVWGHTGDRSSQDGAYRHLERLDLAAPDLAGWLTTFVELGVSARHLGMVLRQLDRLAAMQQADGSWPGGDGSAVEATLTALRVFRGFGLVALQGE